MFSKRSVRSSFLFLILIAFVGVSLPGVATAHFVWVYTEDGMVKVVFGEDLDPDQAKFLDGLASMKAFASPDGISVPIELTRMTEGDEGWFQIPMDQVGHAVDTSCAYGVFGRGDEKMFLDYSAKYLKLGDGSAPKPNGKLSLDLVPEFNAGQLTVQAVFDGKAIEGVDVKVTRVENSSVEATTNSAGTVVLAPPARYLIRAKYSVEESGEHDGESYSEKRYYCTLVMDVGAERAASSKASHLEPANTNGSASIERVSTEFADFPKGMTSFGAAVLNDAIYVMGGKSGKAHAYARAYQNRDVYRLAVDGSDNDWQTVGESHGLQGLAIVSHNNKVYRIGGLEARNNEGEEHDLHSVLDFAEFDPVIKQWKSLPDLPQGRSSLDACVVEGKVYVVGGWSMSDEETEWATEMLCFDLEDPSGTWQAIEAPFKTRALAVRPHHGKLFVIGGIDEKNGPTNAVHIYDVKAGVWSKGAEVPATGNMKSFGCSAVSIGDRLFVSTYDGGIFELMEGSEAWQKVDQLDSGRFFHQMLPIGPNRFVLVGGSHMDHGSSLEVEVFEVLEPQ